MQVRDCLGIGRLLQGQPDRAITSVVYDSRRVEPGALFVALPGRKTDGHAYVAEAVRRGAAAIAVERPVSLPETPQRGAAANPGWHPAASPGWHPAASPGWHQAANPGWHQAANPGWHPTSLQGTPELPALIQVDSTRVALGLFAAMFYRYPSRRMRVVGVTGTNGKTTTAHLVRAILAEQGHRVGLLGTVHNLVGEEELPSCLTTPQASDLQGLLAQMADAGSTYAVMEASSEGLDMHRVDDVEFDLGIFTNLTQDHLDYHKSFDAYREAKARLFRMLGEPGFKTHKAAILNLDDPAGAYYRSICQVPVYTYGLDPGAMVRAEAIRVTPGGTAFTLITPVGQIPLALKLVGRFNVYNALAAATAALVEGVELSVIKRALEAEEGVAGRLEPVRAGQSFGVFVDYAHSPDSLENVLRTARGFTPGRLIVVFGCGGDRDRTKRPLMGRIAAEIADISIITSDNPRSEEPAAIVQEIEAGLRSVLGPERFYEVIVDRTEAIRHAVTIARPDDVIVIAGKGHETYQIFKDRTISFDDRAVARSLIEARVGKD